jgi:uncharacterized phage protein (TIGR01671 family)
MSREIKFKIYDKNDTNCIIGPFNWNKLPSFLYPDNFTLLQYTGLKDKNNVEIYEGDIIRCKSFDGWFDKIGYYHNMEVKYQTLESGDSELSGFLYINIDREVIGNIFENPELLKQ